MPKQYNPKNWYWVVGGDGASVYSSAAGEFVPTSDATFVAWKEDGTTPTSIASADDLAEVLSAVSVRPSNADILDRYRGFQANKLTMEVVAKVLFNHENRIRQLAGQQPVTAQQFINALKGML